MFRCMGTVAWCAAISGLMLATWAAPVRAQEMRTWSDASGKFKIKAIFKGETDGVVTLEQEDGEEIEIETKKLSPADQRLIVVLKKETTDNPFKKKEEDPFKAKGKPSGKTKPSKTKAKDPEPEEEPMEAPASVKSVTIQWDTSKLVAPGVNVEWKMEVPAPEEAPEGKLKHVNLPPKTDFFDKLKGGAIDRLAKKGVVTYRVGGPGKEPATRAVICDLVAGKSGTPAATPGEWAALALHEDGKRIVVRSDQFGFGKSERLEVWSLQGGRVARHVECTPFPDQNGADRDLMWAEFIDEHRLAVSSRGGRIAVFEFPSFELLCYVESVGGAVPALSPNRKFLAYSDGDSIALVDVDAHEVVAKRATPSKLQWPYLAFSPTGRRIGCVAFDRALCWDTATGDFITEIPANGSHFHDGIGFPDDNFLFVGNSIVLDLENQLQLWSYDNIEYAKVVGDTAFFAVTDGNKPGLLMNGKIPHATALDMLKKAQTDPNLFVFKEGSTVSLNLGAIADQAARDRATKAITAELTKMKCSVAQNGSVEIRALVDGPKTREVRYIGLGTYNVQEWICTLEFVADGKAVWRRGGGSNVPGFVVLNRGENMESHLRSCEKPNYHIFEKPVLPKFIQRPGSGDGPGQRMTLGQSRVSTRGFN